MSNPIVLHIERPYKDEADYLAHEAWSIEPRAMLLIGADPLPIDTAVIFDIELEDGSRPIRAEARVVGPIKSQNGRPAGLRVRYRRFGSATKAFIERAAALHVAQPPAASLPPQRSRAPSAMPAPSPSAISSGVHKKPVAPVAPPENRAELLERLRARRAARG